MRQRESHRKKIKTNYEIQFPIKPNLKDNIEKNQIKKNTKIIHYQKFNKYKCNYRRFFSLIFYNEIYGQNFFQRKLHWYILTKTIFRYIF
jgi:hypothetical protein